MYPNPATDMITVGGVALNALVEVYDATGKLETSGRLHGGRLSVATLVPGVHELRVLEGDAVRSLRLVKQ